MKIKHFVLTLIVFICSLCISPANIEALKIIEASMTGVLGAILGGMTAGISVIFSVLTNIAPKISSNDSNGFTKFIDSLKVDMLLLLGCLVASILLPYFRVAGLPLVSYPVYEFLPSRLEFYTAAQLTVLILAAMIVAEVFRVMFHLFSQTLTSMSSND